MSWFAAVILSACAAQSLVSDAPGLPEHAGSSQRPDTVSVTVVIEYPDVTDVAVRWARPEGGESRARWLVEALGNSIAVHHTPPSTSMLIDVPARGSSVVSAWVPDPSMGVEWLAWDAHLMDSAPVEPGEGDRSVRLVLADRRRIDSLDGAVTGCADPLSIDGAAGLEACVLRTSIGPHGRAPAASILFFPGAGTDYLGRASLPMRVLRRVAADLSVDLAVIVMGSRRPSGTFFNRTESEEEGLAAAVSLVLDAMESRDRTALHRPRSIVGRSMGATTALELVRHNPEDWDVVGLDAPFALDTQSWFQPGAACALRYPWEGWLRVSALTGRGMLASLAGSELRVEPATDEGRCELIRHAWDHRGPMSAYEGAFASLARRGGQVVLRCGTRDEFLSFPSCAKLSGLLAAAGTGASTLFFDGPHDETEAGWDSLWRELVPRIVAATLRRLR